MCQAQARGSVAPSSLTLLSCSVSPSCSLPSTLILRASGSTAAKAQRLDVETALVILQSGYCSVKLLTAGSISTCASTRLLLSETSHGRWHQYLLINACTTSLPTNVPVSCGARYKGHGAHVSSTGPGFRCAKLPPIALMLGLSFMLISFNPDITCASGSTAGTTRLLDVESALIILQSGYCSVKLLTAGSISTCASTRVKLLSPQMSRHQLTRTGPHASPAATRCTGLMWRSV